MTGQARRSASVLTLTLALIVGVTAACGGGGGGGGGPAPPTGPQPSMTFTGSSVSAPSVSLARGSASTATTLQLEVRADGLTDVYGVAFDLTFPSGVLSYEGVTEGSFLATGGAGTSLQVAQTASGRLVVGASRLGAVGSTSGSGVLMTLRFSASGSGSGSFGFANNQVLDAQGSQVSGVSWGGGSIQVTQ